MNFDKNIHLAVGIKPENWLLSNLFVLTSNKVTDLYFLKGKNTVLGVWHHQLGVEGSGRLGLHIAHALRNDGFAGAPWALFCPESLSPRPEPPVSDPLKAY